MNFDLLFTLGIILAAAVYLFTRFRRKSGGCCGCSGCSNDLQAKPGPGCPSHKN